MKDILAKLTQLSESALVEGGKYWSAPETNNYNTLWDALVPGSGGAETLEGELLRAATRIYYDWYNNGFGNNWSGALHFIEEHGNVPPQYTTFLDDWSRGGNHWSADHNSAQIEKALDGIMDAVLEQINAANGQYQPTPGDMFDLYQDDDDYEQEEDDDGYDYDDEYDYDEDGADEDELEEAAGSSTKQIATALAQAIRNDFAGEEEVPSEFGDVYDFMEFLGDSVTDEDLVDQFYDLDDKAKVQVLRTVSKMLNGSGNTDPLEIPARARGNTFGRTFEESRREKDISLNVGVEAYGVRGMQSKPWRKKFKSQEAFEKWLDKTDGDVEVLGTREVNLNDMFENKNIAEARRGTFRAGSNSYFKAGQTVAKNIAKAAKEREAAEKAEKANAEKKPVAEGYSIKKGLMLMEGVHSGTGDSTVDHILNRYKAETKAFMAGADLDRDLYEALFDYFADQGEMPYGVMKARSGDPVEWVSMKLDSMLNSGEVGVEETLGAPAAPTLGMTPEDSITPQPEPGEEVITETVVDQAAVTDALTSVGLDEGYDFFFDGDVLMVIGRSTARVVINAIHNANLGEAHIASVDGEEVRIGFGPRADKIQPPMADVNQLATVESVVEGKDSDDEECSEDDKDEVKEDINVNISASEDDALDIIKALSGVTGASAKPGQESPVVGVSSQDELAGFAKLFAESAEVKVDEPEEGTYANEPDEEVAGVEAVITSGDDLHKKKGANPNWQGDNAMRTTQFESADTSNALEESLWAEYKAIK